MSLVGKVIRRILLQRGFIVHQLDGDPPPGATTYFAGIKRRGLAKVCCLDNELRMQTELLSVFPESDVTFSYPIFEQGNTTLSIGSTLPLEPDGRFLAVVDIETLPLETLLAQLPWLANAEVILMRACINAFWSGRCDLQLLNETLQPRGYCLQELVDASLCAPLRAPAGRVVLAWERGTRSDTLAPCRRRRVLEAVTYLSTPIIEAGKIVVLTGRGSFDVPNGICNPGAIRHEDQIVLLGRGERRPWLMQKADAGQSFSSAIPVMVTLDSAMRIRSGQPLQIQNAVQSSATRTEDYRLFRFGNDLISNHVVIACPDGAEPPKRRLRLEQLQTRIAFSKFDPEKGHLEWLGYPTIDRPLARTEKNWVMFTSADELYLIYSFAPFVVMRCSNWPELHFQTAVDTEIAVPFSGDGIALRNSINPVDYDDRHWLHVVHKVYPEKQYTFWPVLIHKRSVRPVRVGRRPLACGYRSHGAGILYLCSALSESTHVDFFFGLDDAAMGWARVSRDQLDRNWALLEDLP